MKINTQKGPKNFAIEGLNEWEMGVLYALFSEASSRFLRDMQGQLQNPKQVRKFLDELQKMLTEWVGSLPKDAPVRKQIFTPRLP